MKQHVYFIPGMFASSLIFERIHLPKNKFEIHYIEWLLPLHKRESLECYINRLAIDIKVSNPVFIGVSFGGIIAQELCKKFPNAKVIIISSVKHHNEFKPAFRFYKKTKLYKTFPITLFNLLEPLLVKTENKSLKKKIELYQKYLPVRSRLYTHWAIHTFLHWQQNNKIDLLHLHGDKDAILPIKYIDNVVRIKNGTHAAVLFKTTKIQKEILRYLA